MSKIREKFKQLREEGKSAFIPFLTAGYPNKATSLELIKKTAHSGADILEIGIPYADSLADGPVLQRASEIALEQGTKVKDVFQLIKEVRKEINTPLVVLVYYNIIYRYGLNNFVQQATAVGIDGLLVPDLPLEEAELLLEECQKTGLHLISMLAPTSTEERIKKIVEKAEGFIYCVSLTGVTGVRNELNNSLNKWINFLQTYTDKPLAVGFGISTPEQAGQVAKMADGVIVGSALVSLIEQNTEKADLLQLVGDFVQEMNKAIKQ